MAHSPETLIGNIPAKDYKNTLYNNTWARDFELAGGPEFAWPEAYMTSDKFESYFGDVWPTEIRRAKGLEGWLQREKEEKGASYVMNFMGHTVVLANLCDSYTAGVVMCLTDISRPGYKEAGLYVVDGDVLFEDTWEKLKNTMKQYSIPGFSLILSVPKMGFSTAHITDNLDISWEIYNRLYGLLLPRGILATQATETLMDHRDIWESWVSAVSAICPDDFIPRNLSYHVPTFSLVKNDRMVSLPKFPPNSS